MDLNRQATLERDFLLGNEAIAWGAIEANIDFIAGYPGTPSTEILETLARYSERYGIYVEWSTNEMVAIENALGASLAGQRAMVTMKHAGFNWIIDPLSVAVQSGVRGGLVIVTADDPECHSSANEQDNRFFGLFLKILTLEPSDPQEAKDMTVEAFSLSEKSQLPVILRSVTRVGHSRSDVTLKNIPPKDKQAYFERDAERFFVTGARALKRHRWLLKQQPFLEGLVEGLPFNRLRYKGSEKKCIITSGVASTYVEDSLRMLNIDEVAVLKIGSVYPLPKSLIKEAVLHREALLVVEEGGPFVEFQLKALLSDLALPVRVSGKMSGDISEAGELNTDIVSRAIARWLGREEPAMVVRDEILKEAKKILPPRTMVFCAGCPHTGTMYAIKKVISGQKVRPIICGDIGCYTLMCYPPHELGDIKYSMGTSIGVASGLSKALKEKAMAVIGDSTFIHAGIPALINAVYNMGNILLVICDNRTTAMTGGQPRVGLGMTVMKEQTKELDIEKLVRGCGVEFVENTDPYDVQRTQEALRRALSYEGVSVVISRRECALQAGRELLHLGKKPPSYQVDPEKCVAGDMPSCQAACPLHVDAKSYISLILKGKFNEALEVIQETLPFPGIIGRVCAHPCETSCKREEVDEAIAINAVKRAAADYGKGGNEGWPHLREREERVAVVGGGPAGLMAAHDLRRMGYRVTLFESLPILGGMLSVGIPEYRLPRNILQTELSILPKLGVEIKLNTKVGADVKLSDLRKDFDAIFLAIGAHKGKRMDISNGDVEALVDGVEFLKKVNLGEKIEAKDKVSIIGGGNVAIDCARTCLRLGFKDVQIFYRRSREEMPAIRGEIQRAEEEGMKINFLVAPTRVLTEKGHLKGVECLRTKLGDPDESGRMRPMPVEGSEFTLDTDMIIAAIGEQPDLSILKEEGNFLPLRDELVVADPVTLETGIPGIFAGGDAVTGPAYVIDALAAGRKAAVSIDRYLRGEDIAADREREGAQRTKLRVDIESVTKRPKQTQSIRSLDKSQRNFQEVEQGFSINMAKEEANRCLACECWQCIKPLACPAIKRDGDRMAIDTSLCPGCGICAQICPEKAIVQEGT